MIDLITVVFQQELFLIRTQAKSIELYVEPHRIKNIYVVINDEDSIADLVDPTWWGVNAYKVKIIPRSYWGNAHTLDGWSSQQLYKLLAAEQAESLWSMCLDAKTWFIQPLEWGKLFSDDNKVHFRSFPTIDVFRGAQKFLENFFNMELPEVIGPGGVPFMFHTKTVKDLVASVDNFFDFFVEHVRYPYNATEFMLYSAFVKHKYGTHSTLYTQKQFYQVYNLADWQVTEEYTDWFTNISNEKNILTASIQGKAYRHLTQDQLDEWCAFLLSKQLITDTQNTKFELNIFR